MRKIIFSVLVYLCLMFQSSNSYGFTFGENGISLNEFFSQCNFITEKACGIYIDVQIPKDMTISEFTESLSDASISKSFELIEKEGKDWKIRAIIMFSMGIAFSAINNDDTVKKIIENSISEKQMQEDIKNTISGSFKKLVEVYNIFHAKNLIAGTSVAFINKLQEYFSKQDKDICAKYKSKKID